MTTAVNVTDEELESTARTLAQMRQNKKDLDVTIKRLTDELKENLTAKGLSKWEGKTLWVEVQKADTKKVDSAYVLEKASDDELKGILANAVVDKKWFAVFCEENHPDWSPYQYLKLTSTTQKVLVSSKDRKK